MIKFKSLKVLGASFLVGASAVLTAQPVLAQSLSEVLAAVRRDSEQMSAADTQRLEEFRRDAASQSARMAEGRNALAAAEAKGQQLTAEFNANEARLGELEEQVNNLAGDFQELLGQFRSAAGATMPEIANSFANFDYTNRVDGIAEIAEARTLPNRSQLERLPKAMLQEMIAQSEVKTFTSIVNGIGPDGSNAEAELIRIGVFTAATTNERKFVEVRRDNNGDTSLQAFSRQPAGAYSSAIASLVRAGEGELVRAPVDPSRGNLFGILGDLPTFGDRVKQGGVVGYVIIAIMIFGILVGLYKVVTLLLTGSKMRATAKSRRAGTGDPLARVFSVYEDNRHVDPETVELKLDEQILKETPKIEAGLDLIKVLAAVSPLLGLLGTVVGMIITFTAITIYGAGDPKLMADGISTALVTTVQGLCSAIPLILLHALTSGMARSQQQLLDEQSAGLVAEKMEASVAGGRA